ncbi:MAG: MlaC/ttg2D family ABC transporter substrate-binding protein [Desulfovibrio sp.]|uniref:MlaC/ttg2D family ABC transporter substrate-binding protein n=1 Tax=Desulfovibrio sp. 7SRBS1 TaxID=3378064 RepID=UPI003B3EF215
MNNVFARPLARFLILFFLLTLTPVSALCANDPQQFIQTTVDKVLSVLEDPKYKSEQGKVEQAKVLRKLGDDIFDWVELSRRTLARNWNELNTEQRKEFVHLYADLLASTYMDRVQSYAGQKVSFLGHEMLSDTKAQVNSIVDNQGKEIPFVYRLILRRGKWGVYDVQVEGVSLVKNYRTQFADILSNQTPDEMLKILREKINTRDKE